jgi:general secretion pathway protein A
MYLDFFSLKERPFNVTSDPNFLFLSRVHKEAFSHLLYGINERKGFLQITGEIGTGKTTLCRALLNQLDKKTRTAFILNPTLPESQFLKAVLEDFGITTPKRNSKWHLLKLLNDFLLSELAAGNNIILIIDEAQNLNSRMLEAIRMLSNLETEKEKLFQIILVGQPQLREKLDSPELAQLRQRVAVRFHITPLEKDEVGKYIYHRLGVAGSSGQIRFADDALEEVYRYSSGVPRLINLVCDRAMLLGYVMETQDITLPIIAKSLQEIEGVVAV